jgi:hypothetical protein
MGRLFRGPFFCAMPALTSFFRVHIFCYAASYARDPRPGEAFGQNLTLSWLVFHLDPALPGVPNILFVDNITGSCILQHWHFDCTVTRRAHFPTGGVSENPV